MVPVNCIQLQAFSAINPLCRKGKANVKPKDVSAKRNIFFIAYTLKMLKNQAGCRKNVLTDIHRHNKIHVYKFECARHDMSLR